MWAGRRDVGIADNAAKQGIKNPQIDQCLCEGRVKKLI